MVSVPKHPRQFEPLPGQEFARPVPPFHKLPVDQYGKARMPTTTEELEAVSKPTILISGGGIGGLTLALLLHKANIPFLVLERAKEIKPLGSAMSMGAPIAPLLRQLGIYDEFVERSKEYNVMSMYKEDLTLVNAMDGTFIKEATGYALYIISRPQLYDLLWNQIPRERILLGKRILSFQQNEDSVMVQCSDNSSYHGDILVGADGAYSAVRQNLYKDLKVGKKLPAKDDVSLPFSCVCLVGQTVPLDPEEFTQLQGDLGKNNAILGTETMCTWATLATKQNTVCWMVIHFLDKESAKRNDSFRNSEWGPEAAEALAREVRVFKLPGGKDGKVLSLGEYVDRTPSHLMSKVMLEEIVFDTWYGGRAVLLGDACHKMNPTGGVGAINAMHDAVTLANWLSTLRAATRNDVEMVFKEYRAERLPVVKEAFVASQLFTRNIGKNMLSVFVRGMIKRLPTWLWRRIVSKMNAARFQASFLPLVEDNAKVRPIYQRSLQKTLPILQKMSDKAADAAEITVPITV